MREKKLAAIGDKDVMLVFKALGFEIFPDINNLPELDDYTLVFIAQTENKLLEQALQKYADRPYPIILAIPDGREKEDESIQKIIKNMERAVGSSAALKN